MRTSRATNCAIALVASRLPAHQDQSETKRFTAPMRIGGRIRGRTTYTSRCSKTGPRRSLGTRSPRGGATVRHHVELAVIGVLHAQPRTRTSAASAVCATAPRYGSDGAGTPDSPASRPPEWHAYQAVRGPREASTAQSNSSAAIVTSARREPVRALTAATVFVAYRTSRPATGATGSSASGRPEVSSTYRTRRQCRPESRRLLLGHRRVGHRRLGFRFGTGEFERQLIGLRFGHFLGDRQRVILLDDVDVG